MKLRRRRSAALRSRPFFCLSPESHADFTLERIALLNRDLDFGTGGDKGVDEINAAVVPVVVPHEKRMRPAIERPRRARLDSNGAHARAHLLGGREFVANEIHV